MDFHLAEFRRLGNTLGNPGDTFRGGLMRVIIHDETPDTDDFDLPSELDTLSSFAFETEINIPVAVYNAIFNLTFTNDAGMQQNRFKIVVISMEESPQEVEKKAAVVAQSAAQEAEFNMIVSTLDAYETLLSGVVTAHSKLGISDSSAPASAIALFQHLYTPRADLAGVYELT